MDKDFLSELDKTISNIGTDKTWERTIGGIRVLFSPISYEAQLKINETIQNSDLGSAILAESKRVTLSYAIVGIGEHDFHEYRDTPPQFPVRDRSGNTKKVSLNDYLYSKMGKWDTQFLDDCFSVFADLMNSHVKENLKDIKFENLKDPLDEMNDLVIRVAEIREQLGLPHLIDPIKEPEKLRVEPEEVEKTIDNVGNDLPEERMNIPADFAPEFKPDLVVPGLPDSGLKIEELPESLFEKINNPPVPPIQIESKPVEPIRHERMTSANKPFTPRSSLSDEVIETKTVVGNASDLKIDKVPENRNPRFSQSR